MPKHRLRAWTGTAFVREISARLREAGVNVLVEGTEHVIVEEEGSMVDAAAWNVIAARGILQFDHYPRFYYDFRTAVI